MTEEKGLLGQRKTSITYNAILAYYSPISSQKRSLQFRKHNALMLAAHMGFKEKVEVIADRKDVDFWKVSGQRLS